MKLYHLSTRSVFENAVFSNLTSYDEMVSNTIAYGEASPIEYDDRVGAALEVFAEFFFARYGQRSNPRLGVLDVSHTSTNKYQVGYDFAYVDFDNQPGHIQSKFRRNLEHKFTRDELGTFISMADEEGIPSSRRILFTNQDHKITDKSPGIFHMSYTGGLKQMRVIDRSYQESFIDRDPSFWADLSLAVAESGKAPTSFTPLRTLYTQQDRMLSACNAYIATGGTKGRVICATGGGKTEVMFRLAKQQFDMLTKSTSVMVAPTIDLLRQHHAYFEQFGVFHADDVAIIHFRTGDEARQDDYIDYVQTTGKDELKAALVAAGDKKVMVFVTYASEQKLFDIMRAESVIADLCLWDEFHHTVRQENAYKDHLLSLPTKTNLFFSASQKGGRIVSSFDEEVYGPLLEDVTYAELRSAGILVPKIVVKPIRINTTSGRLTAIARDLKKAAVREEFDLNEGLVEAAATIVARADMLKTHGMSNVITFSKKVAICKALNDSESVGVEMVGALLQSVHASVPARDRKKMYDNIKNSTDSVLFQHSVVKEGIDITPFNALIISRNIDIIGTQQGIGRVVRAHPEDTAALKAGTISLDSPEGWKKYTATVYVIIHGGEMEDYRQRLKDLIEKLQFTGLTMDDYQFGEIVEERTGIAEDNNADVPITSVVELFETDTIRAMIAQIRIDMEEEAEEDELAEKRSHIKDAAGLANFLIGLK